VRSLPPECMTPHLLLPTETPCKKLMNLCTHLTSTVVSFKSAHLGQETPPSLLASTMALMSQITCLLPLPSKLPRLFRLTTLCSAMSMPLTLQTLPTVFPESSMADIRVTTTLAATHGFWAPVLWLDSSTVVQATSLKTVFHQVTPLPFGKVHSTQLMIYQPMQLSLLMSSQLRVTVSCFAWDHTSLLEVSTSMSRSIVTLVLKFQLRISLGVTLRPWTRCTGASSTLLQAKSK